MSGDRVMKAGATMVMLLVAGICVGAALGILLLLLEPLMEGTR